MNRPWQEALAGTVDGSQAGLVTSPDGGVTAHGHDAMLAAFGGRAVHVAPSPEVSGG